MLFGFVIGPTDPGALRAQARWAQAQGFNVLFLDDEPGAPRGLDPLESAAYAGAVTETIGLVATAAATHAEPFHLSNRFSALDWGTRGRAGWLVTVDPSASRASAYSASVPASGPAARREADAVVDAARRLWDSWEDGALIADSTTGRFLDRDRLHYVDAGGELFRIRGPALMPRPPQGQVPVFARDPLVEADVRVVRTPQPGAFVELEPSSDLPGPGVGGVLLRPAPGLEARLAELRASGTLVPPRPGRTLRDQLGLLRPAGRYTEARS
ncbi:LLM class flavin-dependent oxidoreductase [Cryptosporangium phraense]|uniref:LLM class flavin-dependent oxidoreductase n=1 Tax=Cryptosporangium phraense TaxID=2593070 RepID=A0A545ARZ7_9ACTN|nr:LLM class flavin-dependent oxidoreductase [Cryptosporangium phraense]TQS44106.1 LLM class flavin-dependent oxidoreductase [Cryptosporangium phraense]